MAFTRSCESFVLRNFLGEQQCRCTCLCKGQDRVRFLGDLNRGDGLYKDMIQSRLKQDLLKALRPQEPRKGKELSTGWLTLLGLTDPSALPRFATQNGGSFLK